MAWGSPLPDDSTRSNATQRDREAKIPRNGSGIYSKPAGTTAVASTTIESAKYNSVIDDLVTDANTPRPVVAGGTGATSAAGALTALGLTATAAEINVLDGVTATTAELNILDGATLTVTELNYVDGVTSAIQTQLNAKLSNASPVPLANGGTGAALVDPNADRILFWDDSAGAVGFLTPSTGLAISGTDLTAPGPDLFFRLNSANVGANATGAQNVFPLSPTLEGSTVYEGEIFYSMSKTAGTTNHSISFGYGGTATLNNILRYLDTNALTASTVAASLLSHGYYASAALQNMTGAVGTATSMNFWIREKFTVSINGGGTFIPQYSLSSAPGGAYTTNIGSFILLRRLGASGSDNTQGTWA